MERYAIEIEPAAKYSHAVDLHLDSIADGGDTSPEPSRRLERWRTQKRPEGS